MSIQYERRPAENGKEIFIISPEQAEESFRILTSKQLVVGVSYRDSDIIIHPTESPQANTQEIQDAFDES